MRYAILLLLALTMTACVSKQPPPVVVNMRAPFPIILVNVGVPPAVPIPEESATINIVKGQTAKNDLIVFIGALVREGRVQKARADAYQADSEQLRDNMRKIRAYLAKRANPSGGQVP